MQIPSTPRPPTSSPQIPPAEKEGAGQKTNDTLKEAGEQFSHPKQSALTQNVATRGGRGAHYQSVAGDEQGSSGIFSKIKAKVQTAINSATAAADGVMVKVKEIATNASNALGDAGEKTNKIIKDVTEKITTIQSEIEQAKEKVNDVINQGKEKGGGTAKLAEKAEKLFEKTTAKLDKITEMLSQPIGQMIANGKKIAQGLTDVSADLKDFADGLDKKTPDILT